MGLSELKENFENALLRLREAYERAIAIKTEEDYCFFRDSAIQRFEFTVEIFWKTIKDYLREYEGIACRSPKGCIRDFFSAGYLDEKLTISLLEMIDDRNITSHTYHEDLAEFIFKKIGQHIDNMEKVLPILLQ